MIQLSNKQDCVGCYNCANICPAQCITMKSDEEGFLYPHVNVNNCIHCNKCVKVCPVIQKADIKECKPLQIVGANHKNDGFRLKSSSGGVFGEIASYCLKNGGIVWGAAWKTSYEVHHTYISNINDLNKLQKSKYVQSSLNDSFIQLKKQLNNTNLIIFSGTPCQIKALYNFLGYRPENLITVEIVCHGVPSSLILQRYLEEKGWTSIDFRNKEESWSKYSIEYTTKEGIKQKEMASDNLFMKGFLKDLFTRPSCEKCPAKAFKSQADFTIGDYWGCNTFSPQLYDDKGTSIVFIHTTKALTIWNIIKESYIYKVTSIENAVKYNPCIIQSNNFSNKRSLFFSMSKFSTIKALQKYSINRLTFKQYIKKIILKFWNLGWHIFLLFKDLYLYSTDYLFKISRPRPVVLSIENTLKYIIDHKCSVSRYGDGEIKFVVGKETWFQKGSIRIQNSLSKILKENNPKLIVCIQDIFSDLDFYTKVEKQYWRKHLVYYRKHWYNHLDITKTYYNTSISRCYLCLKDKSKSNYYFNLWRKIWDKRELIIIEGIKTRLGVGNDLFNNAKSIKRILAPNTNAFDYYDNIIEETKKYSTNHLILLALGPTATILAADLSQLGYQAIDIGHIDIEYEWYLMQVDHKVPVPNKFVNEAGAGKGVGDIDDEKYKSEIVCQF